jgi:beta-glucosidase
LARSLRWAGGFGLPILICENGTEDPTDEFRRAYLLEHLHSIWREIESGTPVHGYLHWTLVDNFEWAQGWRLRFGLWALDPSTQRRTKRASADLYEAICRQNGLSEEQVQRYAPEGLEQILQAESTERPSRRLG